MSKTSALKKKPQSRSSTESSSASSSESSSSNSSSSGSDSSSSSDSDSSSSQASAKSSEEKKQTPVKNVQRNKSTDSKPPINQKLKAPNKPTKVVAKSSSNSSEDDSQRNKGKKKSPVKARPVTTTASVKNSPKVTGGKVPPKANPAARAHQQKFEKAKEAKAKALQRGLSKQTLSKKKSIFSPENSSESDGNDKPVAKTQALKAAAVKPRSKTTTKAAAEKKPPPKKADNKPKSKEIISSATSGSSTDSSSSSDSESSTESVKSQAKKVIKKMTPKKLSPKEENSDSETESKQTSTRKSTRTSNTRKSKHLLGKNVFTDTDSDTESTKRSLSRSPVKKAPVAKGKAKNKKADNKARISNEAPINEDRKCPLEECNSLGHLGGRHEKHFTIDACPLYHNLTVQECKENLQERKRRDEARKRLMETAKKSPRGASVLTEQKNYIQKVKESRANFKSDSADDGRVCTNKNCEPDLNGFVPDYDLKLFRDAQAVSSEKIEEELKTLPNTKGTKYIEMGKFEMEVWYQSPYPEEFARLPKLYICEYCLRYMRGRTVLQRHAAKCVWRHPPGEEVYRKDKISVWEVDGKRYKQYCQNLCLLAKFFLDHKTLYFDVEPFLFYVMTMLDSEGFHTVGYFSKEKNSFLNYNVSCILTLPPYQRQGYGRLLIDFSYLLTRVEKKVGSPEKPLSDLGLISYRSYWKDVLLGYLCSHSGPQLSIKDISQEMAINSSDIVSTLQALGMIKYWKGKHIILKKQDVLDDYEDRVKRRGSLLKEVDRSCLRWSPFVPPQPDPS